MQKLSACLRAIDASSEWTGKVVSFAIAFIIGSWAWLVLVRLFAPSLVGWSYITASKLFFVYIIFGAAYILRIRAHVNVDIIHGRLPSQPWSSGKTLAYLTLLRGSAIISATVSRQVW